MAERKTQPKEQEDLEVSAKAASKVKGGRYPTPGEDGGSGPGTRGPQVHHHYKNRHKKH
jgi:hypothetical protein